jgi:NDP-sugar pyrophosphorylase family protein
MDKNIIILAGGASSRMKQSSFAQGVDPALANEIRAKSKSMLTVGQRPFLDYLLFNVEKAGYNHVVIVVGEMDDSIRTYYRNESIANIFPKLTIEFVVQKLPAGGEKPLGTADALMQSLHQLPDWKGRHFTVCNADNLYSVAALSLLLQDPNENAMVDYDRTALKFSEERIAQFAVTKKNEEGFLSDIIEKPSLAELNQARDAGGRIGVSMNIWRFSYNRILPFLESLPVHPVRQEKELPVAVKAMVAQHQHSVATIPIAEHVIDLTTQADVPVVQEYLRTEFPSLQKANT